MASAIDFTPITLTAEENESLIAPFVIERYTLDSPSWKKTVARKLWKARKRLVKRRLLGWLPEGKRTQRYVGESYERTYVERPFVETYNPSAPDSKPTYVTWRDGGLALRRRALVRAHLLSMSRAIELIKPRRVLEVGSGPGTNLFLLAAKFPQIEFVGVELTDSGVAQAKRVQQQAEFPKLLADYCPWKEIDHGAYRRIDFQQGDATKLAFADASFDLVLTRQALEQMEMVRGAAIAEIARVSAGWTLHGEPFADFNRGQLQRTYVAAKDYFSLPIEGLRQFGLTPVKSEGGFPQNIELGIGVVVAQKAR